VSDKSLNKKVLLKSVLAHRDLLSVLLTDLFKQKKSEDDEGSQKAAGSVMFCMREFSAEFSQHFKCKKCGMGWDFIISDCKTEDCKGEL